MGVVSLVRRRMVVLLVVAPLLVQRVPGMVEVVQGGRSTRGVGPSSRPLSPAHLLLGRGRKKS